MKPKADRRRAHLQRGERVFIPRSRMARIRHEESVLRSQLRRNGVDEPSIEHSTCHCGSIDCIAVPISRDTGTLVFSSMGNSASVKIERSARQTTKKIVLAVAHNPPRTFGALFGKVGDDARRLVFSWPIDAASAASGRTLEVALDDVELAGHWELRILDATLGDAPFTTTWSMIVPP